VIDAIWMEDAACREPGVDPELFFPVSESGPGVRQVAAARAVCARCPVQRECRDWALQAGEPAGIWGGTTPEERRLLRSRMLPRPGASSPVVARAHGVHGSVSAAG
jgi:WhiB family transcriptional regulator, redox-sensing transcriptional regulator